MAQKFKIDNAQKAGRIFKKSEDGQYFIHPLEKIAVADALGIKEVPNSICEEYNPVEVWVESQPFAMDLTPYKRRERFDHANTNLDYNFQELFGISNGKKTKADKRVESAHIIPGDPV